MLRVDQKLVISTVEVATRTDQTMTMVVAMSEKNEPTHFMVVLPISQIGKVEIPNAEPVTVTSDDFS